MSDNGVSHCYVSETARKVTIVHSKETARLALQADGRVTTQCQCDVTYHAKSVYSVNTLKYRLC
jgi:hypothetical protein